MGSNEHSVGLLGVPVEEFELDLDHVVEALAPLVDVVVAAATAIELCTGCLVGDAKCRLDGRHRVVLGDDEQQGAAVGAPMVGAVKLRVRPLVASVEPAETAAVRFWIRAMMVSAAALERRVVSAAKVQAAADR